MGASEAGFHAFSIDVAQIESTLQDVAEEEAHHCKVSYAGEYQKFLVKYALNRCPMMRWVNRLHAQLHEALRDCR